MRDTFGLSALELDARLVPLYRLMAETADREAGIAAAPPSGSRPAHRPAGGGSGGGGGGEVMSESEAEQILRSHFNKR
jgi:hypothetical protein